VAQGLWAAWQLGFLPRIVKIVVLQGLLPQQCRYAGPKNIQEKITGGLWPGSSSLACGYQPSGQGYLAVQKFGGGKKPAVLLPGVSFALVQSCNISYHFLGPVQFLGDCP